MVEARFSDHHPLVARYRSTIEPREIFFALLSTLVLIGIVQAASLDKEIQHLLDFIEHSGCTFERNGNLYDSKEARTHIERKYDYIKGRVKRTEDFIRYTASESSMSGRKYHATFDGRALTGQGWLGREMQRYCGGKE